MNIMRNIIAASIQQLNQLFYAQNSVTVPNVCLLFFLFLPHKPWVVGAGADDEKHKIISSQNLFFFLKTKMMNLKQK